MDLQSHSNLVPQEVLFCILYFQLDTLQLRFFMSMFDSIGPGRTILNFCQLLFTLAPEGVNCICDRLSRKFQNFLKRQRCRNLGAVQNCLKTIERKTDSVNTSGKGAKARKQQKDKCYAKLLP